jgi:hypothetical protein
MTRVVKSIFHDYENRVCYRENREFYRENREFYRENRDFIVILS